MIYYYIIILSFIISPISGVILGFMLIIIQTKKHEKYPLLIVISSLFLGLINTNKLPESDLVNYIESFELIRNYGLSDYVFHYGKEPLFYLYNYILYFLTNGGVKLYLIIHTSICYCLLGFALLKIHQKMKFSEYSFITALGILFLFPNLFSLSAHLMRQFLAASIIIFFLIQIMFSNKKGIWLLLSSILVHTTAVIFAISYLLKRFKIIDTRKLFFSVGFFFIIFFILFNYAPFIQSFFSSMDFISYGFDRIQNIQKSIEFENLSNSVFFLFIFIVLSFYYSHKNLKEPSSALLFYMSLILLLFVSVNYQNTELALRFGFYLFFFLPIAFYYLLGTIHLKKFRLGIEYSLILFVFGSWFYYKLEYGTWEYNNLQNLIFIGW